MDCLDCFCSLSGSILFSSLVSCQAHTHTHTHIIYSEGSHYLPTDTAGLHVRGKPIRPSLLLDVCQTEFLNLLLLCAFPCRVCHVPLCLVKIVSGWDKSSQYGSLVEDSVKSVYGCGSAHIPTVTQPTFPPWLFHLCPSAVLLTANSPCHRHHAGKKHLCRWERISEQASARCATCSAGFWLRPCWLYSVNVCQPLGLRHSNYSAE